MGNDQHSDKRDVRDDVRRELTRRRFLIGSAAAGGAAFLAGCTPPSAPTASAPIPASAAKVAGWDAIEAAARQEGVVVVYGASSEALQQVITEDFPKANPGIRVEAISSLGSELVPKIMAERGAGRYIPDIIMTGSFSMLEVLKPSAALAPLKPMMVLPEVVDESAWLGNRLWWADEAEPLTTLTFQGVLITPFYVNTTMVNVSDITSYNDVLDPKFKGRMVSNDIRFTGPGGVPARYIYKHPDLGAKWFDRLYGDQDVTLSRDQRQMVDWVAQGRYPIGLFLAETEARVAKNQGLPISPIPLDQMKEGAALGPGNGSIAVFDPMPHPNAAKVFINWLLSKEGQTTWQRRTEFGSLRIDISKDGLVQDYVPKPGRNYVDGGTEEYGKITGAVFGDLITAALERTQS